MLTWRCSGFSAYAPWTDVKSVQTSWPVFRALQVSLFCKLVTNSSRFQTRPKVLRTAHRFMMQARISLIRQEVSLSRFRSVILVQPVCSQSSNYSPQNSIRPFILPRIVSIQWYTSPNSIYDSITIMFIACFSLISYFLHSTTALFSLSIFWSVLFSYASIYFIFLFIVFFFSCITDLYIIAELHSIFLYMNFSIHKFIRNLMKENIIFCNFHCICLNFISNKFNISIRPVFLLKLRSIDLVGYLCNHKILHIKCLVFFFFTFYFQIITSNQFQKYIPLCLHRGFIFFIVNLSNFTMFYFFLT